jgi:tetratricopeptide (TPR) repeat protein
MQMEHILKKALLVGIFIVPFIPLIITNFFFFPFITGKNFTFRILVELLFGGWLILSLYNPAYRLKFSWLLASITAFVGVIALSDILGENPFKSIWSNFERMEGLVSLVHFLAYFIVVTSVLNTERLWTRFWQTSIGVSVFIGLYGVFQLMGAITINQGGVRLDATFGNATYLAVYMLFHVFITAVLLYRARAEKTMRYMYSAIIALQVFIIYHTATRGSILGLLGGMVLSALIVALFEKGHPVLRKASVATLAGIVLIVGGFFAIKNTSFVAHSPVLSRFTEISISEKAVNARFIIWGMAFEGLKERPLLGWGQENFNIVFNQNYDPRLYAQEQWFDRVHNIVFDWLIAGGVVGFLAYVSMFVVLLWLLWMRKNTTLSLVEKSLLTGLLAGYTFHNLFVFDNLTSYILFFSVAGFIYYSTRKGDTPNTSIFEKHIDTSLVNRMYAPALIALTLVVVYMVNAAPIAKAYTLLQAISVQSEGPTKNIELFKEAIAYRSFGTQEVREQLSQGTINIAGTQLDIETKQKFLDLGISELQKQIKLVPNDARFQIFLGTLYDAYGRYDEATPYIRKALELSPNKPSTMYQLGLNTLNRGKVEEALGIFKQAFELAPEDQNARIFYAVAAIYARDTALTDSLLTPKYGSTIIDNTRILQAYFNTGQLDKVIAIWKLRLEKNPNDPELHLSLGATYLQAGLREQAIVEIQKVIELNPQFKDQGEYYISEIRAGRNP